MIVYIQNLDLPTENARVEAATGGNTYHDGNNTFIELNHNQLQTAFNQQIARRIIVKSKWYE